MIFVSVAPKGLSLAASVLECAAARGFINVAFRVVGEAGTRLERGVECERGGREGQIPHPGGIRKL